VELFQEAVATGEQAAAAIVRAQAQIAEVPKIGGLAVHKHFGHGARGDANDFVFLQVANGNGLIQRAADFRAREKIGLALERDFNVSGDRIVDQERAEFRVVLALGQRELEL